RAEGIPLLIRKFEHNLARRFDAERQIKIMAMCLDHERLSTTPVDAFMDLFVAEAMEKRNV
ncbi:MAG: hypothetical protein ABIS45_12770, partial [Burkholderiales bacterium]